MTVRFGALYGGRTAKLEIEIELDDYMFIPHPTEIRPDAVFDPTKPVRVLQIKKTKVGDCIYFSDPPMSSQKEMWVKVLLDRVGDRVKLLSESLRESVQREWQDYTGDPPFVQPKTFAAVIPPVRPPSFIPPPLQPEIVLRRDAFVPGRFPSPGQISLF